MCAAGGGCGGGGGGGQEEVGGAGAGPRFQSVPFFSFVSSTIRTKQSEALICQDRLGTNRSFSVSNHLRIACVLQVAAAASSSSSKQLAPTLSQRYSPRHHFSFYSFSVFDSVFDSVLGTAAHLSVASPFWWWLSL